jgi:predicted RNase H-like nuclease
MIDRDEMKSRLREGVCSVTFTKVNGETRAMKCTLKEALLPEQNSLEESTNTRKENPSVIAAWDLDKQDWRSFRVDSVIAFESGPTV